MGSGRIELPTFPMFRDVLTISFFGGTNGLGQNRTADLALIRRAL